MISSSNNRIHSKRGIWRTWREASRNAFTLAMVCARTGLNLTLAWIYAGLRITHSLFQAVINKIEVRFLNFILSSLVLLALAIITAGAVYQGTPEIG